jgi:adenosylcobinamide amidohydrolase
MSLPLINEIWKLLKTSIEAGDTDGAAETLVNYLVEEDYSPAEIKQTFRGDKDIKDALDFFMETPEDGLVHEYDDDLDDEDYDYYDDDDADDQY